MDRLGFNFRRSRGSRLDIVLMQVCRGGWPIYPFKAKTVPPLCTTCMCTLKEYGLQKDTTGLGQYFTRERSEKNFSPILGILNTSIHLKLYCECMHRICGYKWYSKAERKLIRISKYIYSFIDFFVLRVRIIFFTVIVGF